MMRCGCDLLGTGRHAMLRYEFTPTAQRDEPFLWRRRACATLTVQVVVTEQEAGGGLAWLQHNVCLNAHLPGVKDKVRAVACDWLDFRGAAEGGNGDAGVAAAAAGPSAEAAERAAGAVGAATGAHGGAAGEGSGEQGHGGEEAAAAATSALACSSTAWLLSQQWDFIIGSDLVYNEVGTTYLPKVRF